MVLLLNGKLKNKLSAHKEGLAHYAYSIFIFNSGGELLLQKRAKDKYHSGGLWTNTCCSHPLSSSLLDIKYSAEQRLYYEMGIGATLSYAFNFRYKELCGIFVENELDYVFVGYSDKKPVINLNEVEEYKWINLKDAVEDRRKNADRYTKWFNLILDRYITELSLYVK
jgi:Isopentenyldiphosphate isomerase